jgi:hypothetical protein
MTTPQISQRPVTALIMVTPIAARIYKVFLLFSIITTPFF